MGKIPPLDQPTLDLASDTDGKQIISYSELSTFRQCPLKHHLSYQRRWTKPPAVTGALAKGTLWHDVLEAHYKVIARSPHNGRHRSEVMDRNLLAKCWEAVAPKLFDADGKQTEIQELITWMYEGYIERYGTDPEWKIVAVEHQIKTTLPTDEGKPSAYVLKAKLDLIVYHLTWQTMWVVDHKSGSDLPTAFELDLDDQFGLYQWAMAQTGRVVQGTLHNAARTTRNKGDFPDAGKGTKKQTLEQRFKRSPMARSPHALVNIALDAYHAAAAAYPPEGMTRSLYSSPNPRSCGWSCDMKEAHLMMRAGRKADEAMREQGFVVDFTRH